MIPQETKPAPRWYTPLVAILLFAALAIAGTRDYNDAELEHKMYCNMVEQGDWPDYDGRYERGECND